MRCYFRMILDWWWNLSLTMGFPVLHQHQHNHRPHHHRHQHHHHILRKCFPESAVLHAELLLPLCHLATVGFLPLMAACNALQKRFSTQTVLVDTARNQLLVVCNYPENIVGIQLVQVAGATEAEEVEEEVPTLPNLKSPIADLLRKGNDILLVAAEAVVVAMNFPCNQEHAMFHLLHVSAAISMVAAEEEDPRTNLLPRISQEVQAHLAAKAIYSFYRGCASPVASIPISQGIAAA